MWLLPVVLLGSLAAGAGAQETVTLEDALVRALARSPVFAQSETALDNAGGAQRTARGAFLPTVSMSTATSRSSSSRFDPATQRQVTGSAESYNAGLSLGYDVFSGGRNRAELTRSGADIRSAEAALENQRYAVSLRTKRLFFTALRQGDLLEVSQARVMRAEEGLELVRRRVEVGTGTRSDSLRARLELANARQVALQAESATRAARFALGTQIGVAAPVLPVRPEELEPRPLPLAEEEVLRLAEMESPSIRAARASTAAASAGIGVARAAFLPTIRLSSGYNWSNDQFGFETGRTGWNGQLGLSYPIFNGFGRSANLQRAGNQQRVTRLQEEDTRLFARQDADAALHVLRTAEMAIALAGEAVAVAGEDLRVVRERYGVGVATILDVITSQISLDQAQVDLVTARYDYLIARAELEAVLGRDL